MYFKTTKRGIKPLALKDNCTNNLGILHPNMLGTMQTIRKSKNNFGIN